MTAIRLGTATLVVLVALTCDITEVDAPPTDNPSADPELTPHDRVQDLVVQLIRGNLKTFHWTPIEVREMLVAHYGQPIPWYKDRERDEERRGEENREGETAPAIVVPQTIVESDSPREAGLVLADEPLVRVGLLDGPGEYLFSNIEGGVRLEDGSIVVADEQSYEIRMFDARGRHVWTSGRQGQGLGEYGGVRLLRGCPGTAITVFDWHLDRITRLDRDGKVIDTRTLAGTGVQPYGSPTCSPDGDLVFVGWPDSEWDVLQRAAVGETYRWEMAVSWERDGVVTLAEGIPGTERRRYGGGSGPATWGRSLAFAAAPTGVWYGSADDYELEHVDWKGHITRIARWAGPDLEVTSAHLDRYLSAYLARYDTPAERRRFERERWPGIRDDLPDRFPAYESDGLLTLPDGSVWITVYGWATPQRELHLLDPDGLWVHRVTIPARSTLLDAGVDWVLLLERGEFDEQSVAVYELAEGTS